MTSPPDLPSIGSVQNKRITAKITIEEIQRAIGKLKTHKAPGSGRFPSEWYKKFEKELSPILLDTFSWIMSGDGTPPSWKEALILVLPKALRDKNIVKTIARHQH